MTRPTVVMLYPGHSAEDEFPLLERLVDGVSLPVVHTWEGPTEHDVAALRALGAKQPLQAATERARHLRPDAVMWACTSGSFVFGPQGVHEQAGWIADAAGVPASSTSIAFVEALRHLGIGRVEVVATYPAAVTGHLTDLLAANGVDVCTVSSADVPTGEDAGRLDDLAVAELVVADGARAGVDAVVVPDTALHTVRLLPVLEERLGTVVLTANQVTAWHGLRLAGWRGRADGLGALFSR